MKIRDAILAEELPLSPIPQDLMYQYVVAGNGLFIRAEDSRIEAMVPVAYAHNHGLEKVEPYAKLKVPRVPAAWLHSVLRSARARLPNEAMYQFFYRGEILGWKCVMPQQATELASIVFEDSNADPVIDLHSHGNLSAFFSETDDHDEQGLRFYCVIGNLDHALALEPPQIALRVGVYGHRYNVPISTVFESTLAFMQVDPDVEMVLAEADEDTDEKD